MTSSMRDHKPAGDWLLQVIDNNALLRKASAVKSEVAMAMRALLRDGAFYVIPVLPAAQPSQR